MARCHPPLAPGKEDAGCGSFGTGRTHHVVDREHDTGLNSATRLRRQPWPGIRPLSQRGSRTQLRSKTQPDDAEWDAGDLRYNVLRWTSSPQPPWGGLRSQHGQSANRTDHRFRHHARICVRDKSNSPGSAVRRRHDRSWGGGRACLQEDMPAILPADSRATTWSRERVLRARGANPIEESELIEQALYELVLHEIGHALGLNHNFCRQRLPDTPRSCTAPGLRPNAGVTGSVMDYAPVNLAPPGQEQGTVLCGATWSLRSLGNRIWLFRNAD